MTPWAPAPLGRSVVVGPGVPPPGPWEDADRFVVDEAVLARPTEVVEALHRRWAARRPYVVDLRVPAAALREPETLDPGSLDVDVDLPRERLAHLVWSNSWDLRTGEPVWWWSRKAARLGARPGGPADVVLGDGTPAWIDGGPRTPVRPPPGTVVVHRVHVEAGRLDPERPQPWPDAATAGLAPDQAAAVTHPGGPARVLAPAGSGKTRVLVGRLRHLVDDRGWWPGSITAVAYNTRAAGEMRGRLGDHPAARCVRTLHALGYAVLREAGVARDVIDEREVRRRFEALADIRPRADADPVAPYLEAAAWVRATLADPAEAEQLFPDATDFARIFTRYRRGLVADGVCDFDEQIRGALDVLAARPDVRRTFQLRCRHLLVDELQDLTPAQLAMIRLLAVPALDVFGVGDEDQVIYGYAGADPEHLVRFDRWFPGAADHPLTVNYRCPPTVVTAAVNLLGRNRLRTTKEIRPDPTRPVEEGAMVIRRVPGPEVAPAAVEVVRAWLDGGVGPSDIAVLARVQAALLAPQVLATRAGIPHDHPLEAGVLRRTGAATMLAYLRLAVAVADGGHLRSEDLQRCAARPARRVSGTARRIFGGRRTWTLASARRAAERAGDRDAARLGDFLKDLERLGALVAAGADAAAVLGAVRDEVGVGGSLERLDRWGGADSCHADDADALVAVAGELTDPRTFEADLRRCLERPASGSGETVRMSTVHRVKGNEWPRVVVVGATEGLVPHRLALDTGLLSDLEEERRVFHVAVTRASERLVVVADRDRPSRFVAELEAPAPSGSPPASADVTPGPPVVTSPPGRRRRAPAEPQDLWTPVVDARVRVPGIGDGRVVELSPDGVMVALHVGGRMRVPAGDRLIVEGRPVTVAAPPEAAARVVERLRAWRRERAATDGVPAYIVFPDSALEDIARRAPADLDALAACRGVGPSKLDRYGDEVLEIVAGSLRRPAASGGG